MQFGYFILYVDDVVNALDFYQRAFGFPIKFKHEDNGKVEYGELETGQTTIGFASHDMGEFNLKGKYLKTTTDGDPFGQEIVFVTNNMEQDYLRAVKAGAIEIIKPTEKPWGQIVAFLRAQEGTLIELCTPIKT